VQNIDSKMFVLLRNCEPAAVSNGKILIIPGICLRALYSLTGRLGYWAHSELFLSMNRPPVATVSTVCFPLLHLNRYSFCRSPAPPEMEYSSYIYSYSIKPVIPNNRINRFFRSRGEPFYLKVLADILKMWSLRLTAGWSDHSRG